MNSGPDPFLSAARALLGERGFTCDPELIEPWLMSLLIGWLSAQPVVVPKSSASTA